jgi:phage shock protein C
MSKPTKLLRSKSDRMIAGICGGIGEYSNTDPTVIRIIAIILALFNQGTILVYLILWLVIPEEEK